MNHSTYSHCTLCPRSCGVNRTTGETGKAVLTVKTAQTDPVTVEFTVE